MAKAIAMKLREAGDLYDIASSKFFGSPTVPKEWLDQGFDEDEIFLCQIRLEDIAPFDMEERLPHKGYLYIFLKTEEGRYNLKPIVRYYEGKPNVVIDFFNECVSEYSHLIKDYLVEFCEVEEDEACTRLFGIPSDWNYSDDPPALLMQFDPLDCPADFLSEIDGFVYFFFEKCGEILKVFIHEEFS